MEFKKVQQLNITVDPAKLLHGELQKRPQKQKFRQEAIKLQKQFIMKRSKSNYLNENFL